MDDFIGRLVARVGVDRVAAAQADGILQFLTAHALPAPMHALVDRAFAIDAPPAAPVRSMRSSSPRSFGRHVIPAALGMGLTQDIGPAVAAFTRETAGDNAVGRMVGAVPGRSA